MNRDQLLKLMSAILYTSSDISSVCDAVGMAMLIESEVDFKIRQENVKNELGDARR